MDPRFAIGYGARALRRGGQRTLLAILSIAFGVMSLVAMQLLAAIVTRTIMVDPRAAIGGDLGISRPGVRLTEEHIAGLDRMRAEGTISEYTLFASRAGLMLKREESGRVYLLNRAMGVDLATYPLVGEVVMRDPPGSSFRDAIREAGQVVVTRDVAQELDLKVGERFTVSGGPGSVPVPLTVAGIAGSMPDNKGDIVLFSLETARLVTGRDEVVSHAAVLTGHPDAAARLQADGWTLVTPDDVINSTKRVTDLFNFMLKGAGMLGLLVGGIGVATTLQVLLARRTLEIATLKTLGYRRRDLLWLFGIETAMLGAAGSVLGVIAAVALSMPLLTLLARTGVMLPEWSADPPILASGLVVGTVTSVVFGFYAIARAGAVRPSVLVRDLPVRSGWGDRLRSLGLLVLLGLLFTAIGSLIMGSFLQAAAVVAGALAGLVALGLLLGAALVVFARLPLPGPRLLALARNNLRRAAVRALLALIALFVGVVAIGFAGSATSSASAQLAARAGSNEGYNVTVYTSREAAAQVQAQLERHGVAQVHLRYQVPASVRTASGAAIPWLTVIEGRPAADVTWDLTFARGSWQMAPRGLFLPAPLQSDLLSESGEAIGLGTELTIEAGGQSHTLPVVGYYEVRPDSPLGPAPGALLTAEEVVFALGGERTGVIFEGSVPPERLLAVGDTLGRALPQSIVVTRADRSAAMIRAYENLFLLAVATAGLALVAGAVLIANAVGLALVERRQEIGVLKSVGFTSGSVLQVMVLEFGLLGLLGALAGTAAVAVGIQVINRVQPVAQFALPTLQAGMLIATTTGIAAATAAVVAWQPARVRPLEVLRDE